MNRISKIIVFILLFGLGMVLGWYTSQKLSKSEKKVNTEEKTIIENDSGNDYEIKKANDKYAPWISYILKRNITDIKIYKYIVDENDPNFKEGQNGLYYIDISKEELKDLFNTMENSSLGIVAGMGGTADFVLIKYSKDNQEYSISLTDGGLIFTEGNDEEFNQLLRDAVKDKVSQMSAEEREVMGDNPKGNAILNWDGKSIYKYFELHDAKVMYYPQ